MSWQQFEEWLEFYSMEPFGELRDDLRAGSIVAAIYNSQRAKATSPILTAQECSLQFTRPRKRKPMTPEEQAKHDRASFDQFKQMVIAVATQ